MDVTTITLGPLMIHDIPRGGSDEAPVLTDQPVQIDDTLRQYFRDKLVTSLQTRGVEVTVDPTGAPLARETVSAILRDHRTLANQSRDLARHLNVVQNAHNPAGLLTVCTATVDGRDAVALMKLERESGIRFDITSQGRHAVVNLELLRQLTLTNKTRVFKTALLLNPDPHRPGLTTGRVSDNQRGLSEGRGVADFFLGTYLGCRLAQSPAVATSKFVATVTAFINDTPLTGETKGRYSMALLTELHSNHLDISPRHFADTHIDSAHRSDLIDRLTSCGFDPSTAFEKDSTQVRYEKLQISFSSGITLLGAVDDVSEHVRIRSTNEGPGAEINDEIDAIRGR